MSDSIFVSVIIPIYNVEAYLAECLTSLLKQTYPHFEVILVNDGSTDGSIKICEEFVLQDARFKLVNKDNGGLSDARNYGIDIAVGDYFTFIDSDDFVTADYLEVLVSIVSDNEADIGIAAYQECTNDVIKQVTENVWFEHVYSIEEAIENMYNRHNSYYVSFVSAWAKIYHRELFKDIRYPIGRKNEDEFTTYKLYIRAAKIVYRNHVIYNYRIREGSIMTSGFNQSSLDVVAMYKERLQILEMYHYPIQTTQFKYTNKLRELLYMMRRYHDMSRYDELKIEYRRMLSLVWPTVSWKKRIELLIMKYGGDLYYRYYKRR